MKCLGYRQLALFVLFLVHSSCQGWSTSHIIDKHGSRHTPFVKQSRLTMVDTPTMSSMTERADAMESRAKEGTPFVESELDDVIKSLQNLFPNSSSNLETTTAAMDLIALRQLLSEIAHLSHKDWTITGENSEALGRTLWPKGDFMPSSSTSVARHMLERILQEGNWDGAANHASACDDGVVTINHPWAVLVTGVNGIRKTTSIYQPWFPDLLAEALVAPPGMPREFPKDLLPCGENTFFRQLDHIIATFCNEEFYHLYALTGAQVNNGSAPPSKEIIQQYSNLKAAIFTRYRTLSELWGVLLLREAQVLKLNCMMETSGRDIAMFQYIDHFFPSAVYRKLALHFTINDLSCAQQSVDARMVREIKNGVAAIQADNVSKVIYANAGGPYGSEVLPSVQEASDRVWNDMVLKNDGVGSDWYKATIAIDAHPTEPWTARAVRPDGTLGTVFTFANNNT